MVNYKTGEWKSSYWYYIKKAKKEYRVFRYIPQTLGYQGTEQTLASERKKNMFGKNTLLLTC